MNEPKRDDIINTFETYEVASAAYKGYALRKFDDGSIKYMHPSDPCWLNAYSIEDALNWVDRRIESGSIEITHVERMVRQERRPIESVQNK